LKSLLLILSFLILFGINTSKGQSVPDTTASVRRYGFYLEKHVSLLLGYDFWHNHYGEIGFAYNAFGNTGPEPVGWCYFASAEVRIGNKLLAGPKIGAWFGGGAAGLALGVNLIYYTDFRDGSLRVRPEVGFGVDIWKVVYGYNIPLTHSDFEGVNRSTIGIALLIGVKKTGTVEKY
jgi:hypothetical protein